MSTSVIRTHARAWCDILKMWLFILWNLGDLNSLSKRRCCVRNHAVDRFAFLQSLKKLEQSLLRELTASSLQSSKVCQTERFFQFVSCGVEGLLEHVDREVGDQIKLIFFTKYVQGRPRIFLVCPTCRREQHKKKNIHSSLKRPPPQSSTLSHKYFRNMLQAYDH